MMSKLFDTLGQKPQNPMQVIEQLKSNPAEFLKGRGFNLPTGVDVTNPQAIVSSLIQSGQIPGGRYQQAMQMIQRMGHK